MPSESDLEARDRERARKDGWFVEKIMRTGRRGFPDRLYIKNGRVVFMEWKKPGGVLEPHQKNRIRQMIEAGAEVYVVETLEQAAAVRNAPR